jgi:CAAX protease family protein
MTTPDLFYLTFIAIGFFLDHFALWPAFLRRSQADPGRARLWIWSGWMGMLWTLVAAGVVLWLFEARDWGSLRLVVPHGWRLWGATGLVLTLAIMYARTIAKVLRVPRSRRAALQNQLGKLAFVLPHSQSELGWFVTLSLSAGFCEEFVFRGYLIWAFRPLLGLWGAAAFSVVVFTAAHAYQGKKGALGTGVAGTAFTLVVLISGSLFPAVALHALVDIGQGLVAWLVLREVRE